MTKDPDAVAEHADWPTNEVDLHARHAWLVRQRERFVPRLMGDPEYFDAKLAGWWVWGMCAWIGSGWCSGNGPWVVEDVDGVPELVRANGDAGQGINRKLPHLGDAGRGIHRKRPHLGDAGQGINRKLPHLGDAGRGIHRKRPHLGDAGQGIHRQGDRKAHILALASRLSGVRVCCGDWSRVCGPSVTTKHGLTAVFLDPPYSTADRDGCYTENSTSVGLDVWRWAVENGSNPLMRIAVCDYEDGRELPPGWTVHEWKAQGGFSGQGESRGRENAHKERIWFSPHCLPIAKQKTLF